MKNWRKILSILLAAAMVVTTYHMPARAAGFDGEIKDDFSGSIEKDGSYLNVSKLGDTEEDETGELQPIDLNEVLRVSIVLDKPGTIGAGFPMKNIAKNSSAMAYRNAIRAEQDALAAKISQVIGKTLDVQWNITLGANIISAYMTRGDMIKAAAVSGVKRIVIENVFEAPVVEPNTTNSPGMIGADTVAWASGYYGAGSKIMIIDTGTNQSHLSFDGDALEYALTKDGKSLDDYDLLTQADVAALASQLNAADKALDAAQSYKSLKIPFSYNYIDKNYTTDHSADSRGEHGSHVSGIAAANRFVKQNGQYVDSLEAVLACGVAPDAQILTAKVFGNKHAGASDSDYFVAIEDAVILGCDAVNLSLGSGVAGFAFSDEYQDKMDMLASKGMVMVTSAGNSYAFNSFGDRANMGNTGLAYNYIEDVNMATNGSPGSFINTLSVASADNVGMTGVPLIFNGSQIVFYWESTMNNQQNPPIPYGNPEIVTIAGDYDYVYIDGYGSPEEYEAVNAAVSLEGKVVVVNRGELNFVSKANNLVSYKPAALIVANNQPGEIYMSLSDSNGNNMYEGAFPMVSISLKNAQELAAAGTAGTAGSYKYTSGKVEISKDIHSSVVADDPTMSDFSSWGGSGSLIMKPEITAPGGNIYSVNGMTNDGYENMSGTSMAAPQVTGIMALFGEYYRTELKDYVDAAFGDKQFTERQLAHSLLMSTSVPMIEEESGTYYPILRQGSGLANIGNVMAASSFLMMKDDATVSAADGKVKAELGQSKAGKYEYTFTIYNPSENDLLYDLSTDLFTQDVFEAYGFGLLDTWAVDMDGKVTYKFPHSPLHDVDKDGDTDTDDVQAILDYLSGERDGADLDLSTPVADLDEDQKVTSYDAVLLLNWLYSMNDGSEDADTVLVPAGTSKEVVVTIDVSSWDNSNYPSGMWVEGYTFVTCRSISEDGAKLDVEHSIPLLGFYGSFTDASMYDANSLTEALYGNLKMTYGDDPYTNYMLVRYEGEKKATEYTGNPYALEDEFPVDRLAINSKSAVTGFHYDLIRAAGTTGLIVRKADEDRNVTDEILMLTAEGEQLPDYFYVNESTWVYSEGRVTKACSVTAEDLGLAEGDVFNISRYAIPEYYAMQLNGSTSSTLTEDELKQILSSTDDKTAVGDGIYLGFTLKVDDTRPTIEPLEADPDSDEITVTFSDNEYVAYVGLMDPSGQTLYDGFVPEQSEAGETLSFTFKKADYAANNAVTIFVADYAGNESAVVVRTGDGPIVAEQVSTIYVPTDTMEEGKEYILASWDDEEGLVAVVRSYGSGYLLGWTTQTIKMGEFPEYSGLYIDGAAVTTDILWEKEYLNPAPYSLIYNMATGEPVYLFNNGGTPVTFGTDILGSTLYTGMVWTTGTDQIRAYSGLYLGFDITASGVSMAMFEEADNVFFFEPVEVTSLQPYDPFMVNSITVDPPSYTLIPSAGLTTVELTATVEPLTAEDQEVVWTSSDETVATVDANGVVTAVSVGVATITATAHDGGGASDSAVINVVEATPMNSEVYAQAAFGDNDIRFVKIDLNDMSLTTEGEAFSAFYGGGRSGDYVYGNDADNDFHRFKVTDGYAYDDAYYYNIREDYALIDMASFPSHTLTFGETEVPFEYDAVGFSRDGKWEMLTGTGVSYFTLGSYGTFAAAAYAGVYPNYTDEDGDVHEKALVYYFLTLDGTLFVWFQFGTETGGSSAEFYQLGYVGMAMSDDITAYSMAYSTADGGLFIADNTSEGIYFVSLAGMDLEVEETQFATQFVGVVDGAVNLSTLYNATTDAVSSLNAVGIDLPAGRKAVAQLDSAFAEDVMIRKSSAPAPTEEAVIPETEAVAEPSEEVTEAPAAEVTEAPADVTEEAAAPAEDEAEVPAEEVTEAAEEPSEEPAPAEDETEEPAEEVTGEAEEAEPANPVVGGLNAARLVVSASGKPVGAQSLRSAQVSGTEDEDGLLFSLTDEEDVTNGIVTLTYDPDVLKFEEVTNPAAAGADVDDMFYSAHEDEESGSVKFVYAIRNSVKAGDEIAELKFNKPCEDTVIYVASSERNQDLDLDEKDSVEVDGEHDWALDSVTWEGNDVDGYTKATFTFICRKNSEHVEVVVDEKISVTEAGGIITYKAEVTGPDGKTYTETKQVGSSTPDTGDVSNLPLFITAGSAATAALLGVMCIRRRKEDEED